MSINQPDLSVQQRDRLNLDLSPTVSLLLDHISAVTGQTKTAIAAAALLDALPDFLARADGLKKRSVELNQVKQLKR
jgi:hypothetical protein